MASAAFDCTVRAAHRSVLETCDPERYQLTQPVCQQLSAVDNGLRHMKLDNHFLDRSELWRQRVPCSEVAEHRERSTDALRRGEAFLQDYRAAMSKEFAETLTDGQSAANQSAALDGLRGFRREFDPNALAAHNRVQRFCDWVGVTDRFTGYRNNLTRGSREPLRFDPQWRRGDADFPRLCHPKFVPETLANSGPPQRFNLRQKSAPLCRRTFDCVAASCDDQQQPQQQRTPQELAGIPTKFPGTTEYKDRYLRPKTASTKFDYVINPQPDFSVIGRPLMKAEPEARTTEYEDRYLWPDSRNLQPLPWSRNPRKDCQ
ncbi:hypothetical protein BOX15_Mlig034436g1 [Macrostomum lignano]|uniref:Uncharacterized protein n=1 Tax=Macrostomum lignano TaxID=282301 RepID=A0A267EGD5_9PLAT|nr:hypothetical protein BOX15_Mlig034436g1 [Macrostomum lignano]